ncbi:MAG: hypothetical protein ACM3NH_01840 [Candidatus Saccharibacteria bacterium]
MKGYFSELRKIVVVLLVSEIIAAVMWVGVSGSGDPALVILAVAFTIAPLSYPFLKGLFS